MKKIVFSILLLLPLGCHSANQNPLQFSTGGSTQSNANMNYQPSIVIGSQPLGNEKFLAALLMDLKDQDAHLSLIEESAKYELSLPETQYNPRFPTPLNTSVFSAMRVAYPKEFLELDDRTRTSFMIFYRQLDKINTTLVKRSDLIPSALSNANTHRRLYDQLILEDINTARNAIKNLKRE